MMNLALHGYRYSVYTRTIRIVLREKRLSFAFTEVDPFSDPPDENLHPFGRVPVLIHGDITLFESTAITRYLDAAFPNPALTPAGPLAQARMTQVMSIIDSYGYWPLVRQVFSHRVFRPLEGGKGDETEIAKGLAAAETVLGSLENIASEGLVLSGDAMTLADAHLAPMIDYFQRAPEGVAALSRHPHLTNWWREMRRCAAVAETDPGLP